MRAAADLVKEVAAATREQAENVGQMIRTVGESERVTQRTAMAAEQLAATSAELNHRAGTLQGLMDFFRGRDQSRAA
jgi:methyl-accepting chemotaxis protein